eukprot:TRINITY_DN2020_c0_g1_i1.p1 TRINITY_DN2020_c0_g1~~TRINITY_DN2020_c0_g1_i1.p1  ORF type:complete len:598 (+),score=76.25 TRINITY_DN2020_c0_g1_i1:30-1796(+)
MAEMIDVIDVTTKSTIKVPVAKLYQTAFQQQRTTCPNGEEKIAPFTVCELFQKGKCDRKEQCRHVHVDTDFLRAQRAHHFVWMHEKADTFAKLPPNHTFEVFNATMKEVMDVPKCCLEFTRGLFLSPEDRDRRQGTPSASAYCGKVPTACLLFLGGSCKWGEHCNQAHISKKWLNSRNREFQTMMQHQKASFDALASTSTIEAYHPNLNEIVLVPRASIIQFTRGLYQASEKTPSICLLHQKGKCSCEELCKQIHVDPQWMAKQKKGNHSGRRRGKSDASDGSMKITSPASIPSSVASSPGCSSMSSHRSVSPLALTGPENINSRAGKGRRANTYTGQPPDLTPLVIGVGRPAECFLTPFSVGPQSKLNVGAMPFSPGQSAQTPDKKTLSPILVTAQPPISIPEAVRLFTPLTLESSHQCIDRHSTVLGSPTGEPELDFLAQCFEDPHEVEHEIPGLEACTPAAPAFSGDTARNMPVLQALCHSNNKSTVTQRIPSNEVVSNIHGLNALVEEHSKQVQQVRHSLSHAIASIEDQCEARQFGERGTSNSSAVALALQSHCQRFAELSAQFATLTAAIQATCGLVYPPTS